MKKCFHGSKFEIRIVVAAFGQHASVEKCLEGSIKAEAHGFDSVWVRSSGLYTYAVEGTDNTHIEGLLVLSAVAAVTKKLTWVPP